MVTPETRRRNADDARGGAACPRAPRRIARLLPLLLAAGCTSTGGGGGGPGGGGPCTSDCDGGARDLAAAVEDAGPPDLASAPPDLVDLASAPPDLVPRPPDLAPAPRDLARPVGPFSLCVSKTPNFPCLAGMCRAWSDNASRIPAPGSDVLDCLGATLAVPSTMTVRFDYAAQAQTCFDGPVFTVAVGGASKTFPFGCMAMGSSSLQIAVPQGTALRDVSFSLTSGDWGSSIRITAIAFN